MKGRLSIRCLVNRCRGASSAAMIDHCSVGRQAASPKSRQKVEKSVGCIASTEEHACLSHCRGCIKQRGSQLCTTKGRSQPPMDLYGLSGRGVFASTPRDYAFITASSAFSL